MGRAVVVVAARIFSGFQGSGALHVVYHVTPVSLINGFAIGFLIALVTVALTSLRISRINIIAAIRDLPTEGGRRMKRRWVVLSTILAAVFGALSVPAIASSGVGAYLFPPLAVVCLVPMLLRVAPKRWVYSGVALAVLVWSLAASTVRPQLLENGGSAAFILMGVLLTFSAVLLVSQNQEVVTAPLRPLIDRASQLGLSTRLAVAYPLGKRFRTGAILIMYGLVVFTLVIITVMSALFLSTVTRQVASASGGFGIRADFNPAAPIPDPSRTLTTGRFAGKVEAVAPLSAARGKVTDLNAALTSPVDAVVVGVDASIVQGEGFLLAERSANLEGDRAAWSAVLSDPRYVIVDNLLGQLASGGPTLLRPGGTFTLTDPLTGARARRLRSRRASPTDADRTRRSRSPSRSGSSGLPYGGPPRRRLGGTPGETPGASAAPSREGHPHRSGVNQTWGSPGRGGRRCGPSRTRPTGGSTRPSWTSRTPCRSRCSA